LWDASIRQPADTGIRVASPAPDFASAYEDHVWQVYGFFAYRVSSREAAEDLTQLTFERGWRAWGRYDPLRAQVSTWLLTIARNLLIDHYRSAGAARIMEPLHDTAEQHLPTAEFAPSLGLTPELARALAGLDLRAREVVALRYGGDLTGPEIAELTGLSLANVQQILSRSLRQMRLHLGESDEEQTATGSGETADPAA
jgi:RNA polymerase sigma-70 factor (ECF subfamily)